MRFLRKENGSIETEVWLGDYPHSGPPKKAPMNVRAVGDSGGWKVMPFSKILQKRKLREDAILTEITKLTDAWTAQAEREWSLADKLLQTHAGNIGLD